MESRMETAIRFRISLLRVSVVVTLHHYPNPSAAKMNQHTCSLGLAHTQRDPGLFCGHMRHVHDAMHDFYPAGNRDRDNGSSPRLVRKMLGRELISLLEPENSGHELTCRKRYPQSAGT